ncbi:MAG TPA: LPS assembly lipoprotein LptE [Syntrophorhabdaceae bacterium]|nr:LPS assembly lipoprotein LptE [Syntrophorhabdaceae bacterium]
MKLKRHFYLFVLCVLFLSLTSCGYELVKEKGIYGGEIRSVYVPVFKNMTYEPHISQYLTDSFTRQLLSMGILQVNKRDAETYIEGILKSIKIAPSSLDKNGIVIEKSVTMDVEISLFRKDGNLIKRWSLADSQSYRVDELNYAEYNKKQAISIISERIARRFSASILTEY